MKSIMISVKPKWIAKILNGEKTIEIRKKFPKDYVGWVYIYCTKGKPYCMVGINNAKTYCDKGGKGSVYSPDHNYIGNRKVVARFYCDKVDECRPFFHWCIEKETCLTRDEVLDYLDSKDKSVGNPKRQEGKVYAIHISDLEIFDRPKKLSEFWTLGKHCKYKNKIDRDRYCDYCYNYDCMGNNLVKAPQNFCYVKGE